MKVLDKVNWLDMRAQFNAPTEEVMALGEVRTGPDGRKHSFIDNGGSVLAIAHLDSVLRYEHFYYVEIGKSRRILSTVADDRLGVYTITKLLPSMGLKFDILLTTDEETGRSTAAHFSTAKKYNWMFMFDRRGEDAVTYMYDSKDWKAALEVDFKLGNGSASCISKMEGLGVSAVNIGGGYHDEHQELCYIDIDEWSRQVARFAKFFHRNKAVAFPHTPKPAPTYTQYQYRGTSYDYDDGYTAWWNKPGTDTVKKSEPVARPPFPLANQQLPTTKACWESYADHKQYTYPQYPTECAACHIKLIDYGIGSPTTSYRSEEVMGCCEQCENDRYVACEFCGEYGVFNDHIQWVNTEDTMTPIWLCFGCMKENYEAYECTECGQVHILKDMKGWNDCPTNNKEDSHANPAHTQ